MTPVASPSIAQRVRMLPSRLRRRVLEELGPGDASRLLYQWRGWWARESQLAPTDAAWLVWCILSGRGWGKTRTAAEWVRERIELGIAREVAIIAPTIGEAWKYCVFGTEAAPGIVRLFPPHQRPRVIRRDCQIFFHTGAVATVHSAEDPEYRGANNDTIWADEIASWRYLDTIWPNIEMTLRALGPSPPRICISTTPRPLKLLRAILAEPWTRTTVGTTFENAANVAPSWLEKMRHKYEGTRLGEQELLGILLGDNPDALFHQHLIDEARVVPKQMPRTKRVVVGVDPHVSQKRGRDETGIVVVALGENGHLYVLDDVSGNHSPEEWATAVKMAQTRHGADAAVAERNRGGDLVASNLRAHARTVRVIEVHATKGKATRAEPLAALYEQKRVHHVGRFADLEQQMTDWNPKMSESPDRLDALVWAAFELLELGKEETAEERAEVARGAFRGLTEANQNMPRPRWSGRTLT